MTGRTSRQPTKGIHLIEVVHPEVKSPAMTGQWEAFLKRIQQGESRLEPFLDGISQYVRSVVSKVGQNIAAFREPRSPTPATKSDSRRSHRCKKFPTFTTLTELLQNAFGFSKLPAQPGSRLQSGHGGERRTARHADRFGQVALLPVARIGTRWNDPCDQSTHRIDGRSGS